MAFALKFTFWFCIGAIVYNYAGYPILLFCLATLSQAMSDISFFVNRKSRRSSTEPRRVPRIAIIISAFNEESVIEAKVANALNALYPPDLVEILIGLDSPADSTAEILSRIHSPRVRVFPFTARRGKLAVITDLAQRTDAEILVFTDANTIFEPNCVANLLRHFENPKVGAVSGEEIRVTNERIDPAAEGLYWRYESALKILESRIHCLHSANGGVYAIRRELFRPRADMIVEDFQIPLDVRFGGHWIIYDPEAIGVEEIAPTFTSQFERRVRLGAGNFQTLLGHPGYLNPFKGRAAFAYWSHRVLRWLTPFLLLIAFACTAGLYRDLLYRVLFYLQIAFYGSALFGYWRNKRGRVPVWCKLQLYFCSMNAALVLGLFRYLRGSQSVAWAATPRSAPEDALPSRSSET
jgi:cellulose synthase/poly-beta-1,6-N-acetylglucosamine synthase-like glycosyltransferase